MDVIWSQSSLGVVQTHSRDYNAVVESDVKADLSKLKDVRET